MLPRGDSFRPAIWLDYATRIRSRRDMVRSRGIDTRCDPKSAATTCCTSTTCTLPSSHQVGTGRARVAGGRDRGLGPYPVQATTTSLQAKLGLATLGHGAAVPTCSTATSWSTRSAGPGSYSGCRSVSPSAFAPDVDWKMHVDSVYGPSRRGGLSRPQGAPPLASVSARPWRHGTGQARPTRLFSTGSLRR